MRQDGPPRRSADRTPPADTCDRAFRVDSSDVRSTATQSQAASTPLQIHADDPVLVLQGPYQGRTDRTADAVISTTGLSSAPSSGSLRMSVTQASPSLRAAVELPPSPTDRTPAGSGRTVVHRFFFGRGTVAGARGRDRRLARRSPGPAWRTDVSKRGRRSDGPAEAVDQASVRHGSPRPRADRRACGPAPAGHGTRPTGPGRQRRVRAVRAAMAGGSGCGPGRGPNGSSRRGDRA